MLDVQHYYTQEAERLVSESVLEALMSKIDRHSITFEGTIILSVQLAVR